MNSLDQYYANLSITWESNTDTWLDQITAGTDPVIENISVDDLLLDCKRSHNVKGYIRYDYEDQKLVIPNLVTLAAVLDAALVDDDFLESFDEDLPMIFDATEEWSGFDAYDATEYMYENHIASTQGLMKSNPGFDSSTDPFNPELTKDMNAANVDFAVSNKMFNFFLTEGCIPLTREHELMKKIAAWEGFEKPTAVWGYDNTFSYVAGSKFEAETDCVNTLGQVASTGVPNLSFFGLAADPIEEEGVLVSNPFPKLTYDPDKTYISLLLGDGDNLRFVVERHLYWWQTRQELCSNPANWTQYNVTEENACFPLAWSLSPQLLNFAPQLISWWYDAFKSTGSDYFVLPPSGELYSYPGGFSDEDQIAYKSRMQKIAGLMDISGTVHWEFPVFSTWNNALSYFEKYAEDEEPGINGFHCVNVPYFEPILEIFGLEDTKVLNDKVVLFKSIEWRGGDGGPNAWAPADFAKKINNYEPGSIKSIYVTSDGGFTFIDLYELVGQLDMRKVVIVNQEQLVDLALQRHERA
ncbi:hypothetical protein TrST_g10889 [Triparma strigata]|uniref:GxGYxYP putative glycoside hydrolase C-terminal domain-containing protein n=1 Tax=Triparma strigata TaxID=1606541 RepID=A0A9W6ZUF2_9STRA|nr:hypothetical protein TrST_g10889 [Triparma strigata]